MTTDIAKNIFRFILLILVQVIIIQNINLSSYVILLPYVLVIILLPFELSRVTVLLISFFLGICIDYFFDSSGLHTSACTLMGFSRYYVLKFISPRDGYDIGVQPTVNDMGLAWFLSYAGTLIIIHHFFFFYIEVFRFSEFFGTFFRAVLSSLGTFILVYLIQFLFFTERKRS
ncbi:MAG: rod shape-determining protein MreD [Bacteroidota bacterium]|nr:rod shape-determining protein MreD [Bacteroidota bacterium]